MKSFLRREAAATGLPVRSLLVASVLLHLVTGYLAWNPYHPDEHFQIQELAFARAGLAPEADLPWEWDARIRPTLQPTMALGALVGLRAVGIDDPFVWTWLLRLVALAGSFAATLWIVARVGPTLDRTGRRALWLVSLFLWCLPWIHTRFSSETVGGMVFVGGILLLARPPDARREWLGGTLVGLAFLLRFQMAFAALGLYLWMLLPAGRPVGDPPPSPPLPLRQRLASAARAALPVPLVVAAGTLLDRWFYGEWVFTPWRYFEANILDGVAATFGVEPWYFYLTETALWLAPPLGPVLVGVALWAIAARPRSAWVWVAVPFLVGHSLVGHKELRFLFPMLWALPVACAWAADAIPGRLRERSWLRAGVGLLAAQNVVLLLVMATPALHQGWEIDVHYFRAIWNEAEAGPAPLVVGYVDHEPHGTFGLTFNVFRHPDVVTVPGDAMRDRADDDARFLVSTRQDGRPEVPGFETGELVYRAEPGYRRMVRPLGLDRSAPIRALERLHRWDATGYARRLYRLRPEGGGTAGAPR